MGVGPAEPQRQTAGKAENCFQSLKRTSPLLERRPPREQQTTSPISLVPVWITAGCFPRQSYSSLDNSRLLPPPVLFQWIRADCFPRQSCSSLDNSSLLAPLELFQSCIAASPVSLVPVDNSRLLPPSVLFQWITDCFPRQSCSSLDNSRLLPPSVLFLVQSCQ